MKQIDLEKERRRSFGRQNLPPGIDVAEETIAELTASIQSIEADLCDKDPIDPRTGEPWTRESHNAWKQKAMHAKMIYTKEKAFLKRWIHRERILYNSKSINVDYNNPKSLIHAAHVVLGSIRNRGIEFTDEEKMLMDVLYDYLQHN